MTGIISKNSEKKLFWLSISVIVGISYRLYSSRYYPLLDSDDALSVLMTHYYKLPTDIYCWGQNRGGTLIPFISQLFYKGFGFSEINAVSISNYLLLIIGFLGFSSLFKNKFTKILFAFFWFFPPMWFINSLRYPYGVQYCLIGVAVLIIDNLSIEAKQKITTRQHLLLILLILIFTSAVWVSDLAAVTVLILIFTISIFHLFKNRINFPHKLVMFYFIIGCVFCTGFILYAKNILGLKNPEYLKINSFAEASNGIRMTKNTIINLLSFKINNPFMSVYVYFVILLAVYFPVSFYFKKIILSAKAKQWLSFFLMDGLIIFVVILFSRWALIDGYGRRFFICSYISFGLAILILADYLITISERKNVLKTILFIIVLVGSISTVYDLKYVNPKNLTSTYKNMREFETLGECGIIGDYWNSYIVSISNPGMIKAAPHDKNENRNNDIVNEIFKKPYVYIIKDNWLENYPDTLSQHWRLMYKDGKEFAIGGKSVCRYKIIN